MSDRYQNITAHQLIANLCVEMANEIYEEVMHSNALYKVHKDRADFVRQCAPTLKAEARSALAQLLARPDVSDYEKQKIHEALVLDNEMPKTGVSVVKKKDI